MPDQPLQPFAPPASFGGFDELSLPDNISASTAVEWILYIVFAFWAIYTIIAIYHWLKYSHASWVAFPSIALHLFVSFALMAYALSGTLFI